MPQGSAEKLAEAYVELSLRKGGFDSDMSAVRRSFDTVLGGMGRAAEMFGVSWGRQAINIVSSVVGIGGEFAGLEEQLLRAAPAMALMGETAGDLLSVVDRMSPILKRSREELILSSVAFKQMGVPVEQLGDNLMALFGAASLTGRSMRELSPALAKFMSGAPSGSPTQFGVIGPEFGTMPAGDVQKIVMGRLMEAGQFAMDAQSKMLIGQYRDATSALGDFTNAVGEITGEMLSQTGAVDTLTSGMRSAAKSIRDLFPTAEVQRVEAYMAQVNSRAAALGMTTERFLKYASPGESERGLPFGMGDSDLKLGRLALKLQQDRDDAAGRSSAAQMNFRMALPMMGAIMKDWAGRAGDFVSSKFDSFMGDVSEPGFMGAFGKDFMLRNFQTAQPGASSAPVRLDTDQMQELIRAFGESMRPPEGNLVIQPPAYW